MITIPVSHADDIVHLESRSPEERIRWALMKDADWTILSTSFGVQSAVLLHMVAIEAPTTPVVFVDTGFLFKETYQFAEELTGRLGLNLCTYKPALTPEEMVAEHGELWNAGEEGLATYNEIVKVEPMRRALTTDLRCPRICTQQVKAPPQHRAIEHEIGERENDQAQRDRRRQKTEPRALGQALVQSVGHV